MDPPGPNGPGAFACPLLIAGTVVIEKDAPPGTFPLRAIATGAAQVWFVDRTAYDAATADGTLLMSELLALAPLRGTATELTEMLAPPRTASGHHHQPRQAPGRPHLPVQREPRGHDHPE